jgi:hypothetical protein
MHRELIAVRVAISSHGLLGSIYFEETVNSERYLSMLRNTSVPHHLATGLPLQTHWFMQDGARPHTVNVRQAVASVNNGLIAPTTQLRAYQLRCCSGT